MIVLALQIAAGLMVIGLILYHARQLARLDAIRVEIEVNMAELHRELDLAGRVGAVRAAGPSQAAH